jgi:hypothetical protein
LDGVQRESHGAMQKASMPALVLFVHFSVVEKPQNSTFFNIL